MAPNIRINERVTCSQTDLGNRWTNPPQLYQVHSSGRSLEKINPWGVWIAVCEMISSGTQSEAYHEHINTGQRLERIKSNNVYMGRIISGKDFWDRFSHAMYQCTAIITEILYQV